MCFLAFIRSANSRNDLGNLRLAMRYNYRSAVGSTIEEDGLPAPLANRVFS